jgi:hypothetical protein
MGKMGGGVWLEWGDLEEAVRLTAAKKEAEGGGKEEAAKGGKPVMAVEGEAKDAGEKEKKKKKQKRGLMLEFDERGAGCWERERLGVSVWKTGMLFLS